MKNNKKLCFFDSLDKIQEELTKKYDSCTKLSRIRHRKSFFNIIYHKINIDSLKTDDSFICDGFFEVKNSEPKKYYTSFDNLIKYCNSQKLLIKKFKVVEGYKGGIN